MSADGKYVAYNALDDDLKPYVSVYSLIAEEAVASIGNVESEWVHNPSINQDGSLVVYSKLDLEDSLTGIYMYNVSTEKTTAISVDSEGSLQRGYPGGDMRTSKISEDGNTVCFSMAGVNLDPIMTTFNYSIFARDISEGTTTMVSSYSNLRADDGLSTSCSVSSNGRFIVFDSLAQFVEGEYEADRREVFMRDMDPVVEDLDVTLSSATVAFGDDLVIEFAVSGGVPAYTCEWYYKMPGSDEFVAPGHNDCETWVINGAMVTGMYEEVDPVDPVDILFKVEVTDALETAVMSNVATITID